MKYSVEGFYCPGWLKKIVEGIGYKPGWELRIHARTYDLGPQTHEPYMINIAAVCTVEDVVTRNPIMLHGPYISIYTDHRNDEKMVVEMIFRCIRELEHHEMEEQFSYNGTRIYDPHRSRAENEKLFDLAALRP
jgi:hypothetical protein